MKKIKILITGGVSLLGKYLIQNLSGKYEVYSTYNRNLYDLQSNNNCEYVHLNITDSQNIGKLFDQIKPTNVIHLASISNIDNCQQNPDYARKINVESTKSIIAASKKYNSSILFLSSNAVFDGTKPPYSESNLTHPLNIYGKTKVQAENLIVASNLFYTIIRSTTMYGWPPKGARDNDITYYLKRLYQPYPIYLVNDQFFNPVYALRVAQLIEKCIQQPYKGFLHIGGKDIVSRYTFVKKIKTALSIKTGATLIPVSHDYFKNIAPRPKNASLKNSLIRKKFGINQFGLSQELKLLISSASQ